MSKIDKLTPKQEKELVNYRDKWLAKGLCTDRIDRKKAIREWMIFNKLILGNKKTPLVIFMDSPRTTWLATCLMCVWTNQVGGVRNQVWNQVENQVGNQVRDQVENQVWNQVGNQVWNQVWNQVGNQVGNQVRNQVWNQVRDQLPNFIYPYLNCSFWAGYLGFYDYCNNVLGIKFNKQKEWDSLIALSELSWIYPFKEFVVISEKPTQIKIKDGQLHNENGPSVLYADGFSIYSLNGVRVSKKLVETPADKLDAGLVTKETNADIRREIVRKIGVDRVYQKLGGKTLDKQGDVYELITLNLGDNRIRPYLKMKNPSIGVYHLEGVSPNCITVSQALEFRNGTKEKPVILT